MRRPFPVGPTYPTSGPGNSCGTHRRDAPTRHDGLRGPARNCWQQGAGATQAMASSSSLGLAMTPGVLLHRRVVTHASFIRGRGRSASGRRSRNLALSASSNGTCPPSLDPFSYCNSFEILNDRCVCFSSVQEIGLSELKN
jgi:hypothetical protein